VTHATPEFSLSRSEYVRASWTMQNRRWVTWLVYEFFTAYIVALLVRHLWLSSRGRPVPAKTLVGATGSGALVLVLTYWWPSLMVQHSLRRHSTAFQPHIWRIGDTGLEMSGPDHSSELGSSAVRRVVEDQHLYYFYASDAMALILPKRVLDPHAVAAFRNDIREWWKDGHRRQLGTAWQALEADDAQSPCSLQ
jgi:hypothetical protein